MQDQRHHSSKQILSTKRHDVTTLQHRGHIHRLQHGTNIPDSILTGDVNAHSALWYSHTNDHRRQLISDIISNSEHFILNTDTPTRMPHTTLQQTISPDITTMSTTLYSHTTWHTIHALNSVHLPIITTINTRTKYNYNKTDTHSRTIGKHTGHSSLQTPRLISLTFNHHQTYTLQTPSSQTQYPRRQERIHMQTTSRTHKTQNRTQKQNQITKRK